MKRVKRWIAAVAVLSVALCTCPPLGACPDDEEDDARQLEKYLAELDFEAFAQAFREEHCGRKAKDCSFESILASQYLQADLGAFHVQYPARFLKDKKHAQRFPQVMGRLLDLQAVLIDWLVVDAEVAGQAKADGKLVGDWIRGLRVPDLKRVPKAEDKGLFVALAAPVEIAEASQRFKEFMRDPQRLGVKLQLQQTDPACEVIFSPTRRDFIELFAICGEESKTFRDWNFKTGLHQWTQCWLEDWTMIMSLEYASWDGFDKKFRKGMDMNRYAKAGLEMMVVQQAAYALFFNLFARGKPRHEEDGLARNLVIAVCGEIDTIDNERGITTSGGSSSPFEMFVPGGNPGGGQLSPIPSAGARMVKENQWRIGHGADNFVAPLQKGQRRGGKKAAKDKDRRLRTDKTAHFLLEGDKGDRHVVTAPFFGEFANEAQYPPENFMHDYRQFFESYTTSFMNWLRHFGAPSEQESKKKFAQLLREMGLLYSTGREFHQAIEATYGVPVSHRDGEVANLEWRFLNWLHAGES